VQPQPRPKAGVTDAIDMVNVKHKSGGTSLLVFKSYDAGVDAFAAQKVDFIHRDEEADTAIYVESLMRTMTNHGVVYITATPMQCTS
jgi:phage terminase large subunit-like protein